MRTENDLVVEDNAQSANEYGFDDRYKPQYDLYGEDRINC
jgi:hypothetical protein